MTSELREINMRNLEAKLKMPLYTFFNREYSPNQNDKSDNTIAREIKRKYQINITSSTVRSYRLELGIKSKKYHKR